MRSGLRWCVEELDQELGSLYLGALVVILGHPGVGKTTLVSKILECNLENGFKAVYFSTSETRDKYFRFMEDLGIRLRRFDEEGRLRFVEVPTLSGESACEFFTELFTDVVAREDPDIIVIDSVTPVLWFLKSEEARRSFLHAGIYKLVSDLKKTVILVGDLPYGRESVELGGIEFVADVVLIAKLLSERGRPTRRLEVRKVRGRGVRLCEIPFTIVSGPGIKIIRPPISKHEISSIGRGVTILNKDDLGAVVGPIYRGEQVLVTYPVGADVPLRFSALLARRALENNLKLLIITSSTPSDIIYAYIHSALENVGCNVDINELMSKVKILVQDLFTSSITEVMGKALAVAGSLRPDIIVVLDVAVQRDVLWQSMEIFNLMNYAFISSDRASGIVTFRLLGVNEKGLSESRLLAEMSDVVMHIEPIAQHEYSIKILKNPFRRPRHASLRRLEQELSRLEPATPDTLSNALAVIHGIIKEGTQ